MLSLIAKNWWALALRGLLALAFGAAGLIWRDANLSALVLVLGLYVVVDGVFRAMIGLRGQLRHSLVWLLSAAIGTVAGLLIVAWPGVTGPTLFYLVAAWAVGTGLLQVIAAIRLREEMEGEWLLAIGGAASITVGLVLLVRPALLTLAIIVLMASYELAFGVLLVILSMRLRNMSAQLESGSLG